MDNTINLSFEDAGEVSSLFSDAGATSGGKFRICLEGTITEITEEGVMMVPDTVESVTSTDPEGAEGDAAADASEATDDISEVSEDVPSMVQVMEKKMKKKDGG